MQNNIPAPPNIPPSEQKSPVITSVLSVPASLPEISQPRTSQGVTPGSLEHTVQPIYPAQAREVRIEGAVKLLASIGADGRVYDVRVISGSPLLVPAAVDAVRQWRYKPYKLNNEPVAARTEITINFKLP
jgi:protein TonB